LREKQNFPKPFLELQCVHMHDKVIFCNFVCVYFALLCLFCSPFLACCIKRPCVPSTCSRIRNPRGPPLHSDHSAIRFKSEQLAYPVTAPVSRRQRGAFRANGQTWQWVCDYVYPHPQAVLSDRRDKPMLMPIGDAVAHGHSQKFAFHVGDRAID
jgi:hypothetical protein